MRRLDHAVRRLFVRAGGHIGVMECAIEGACNCPLPWGEPGMGDDDG